MPRRKTKKRDPNAPKHPISSFLFFSFEKRKELRENHPEWSISEVSKELGSMWRAMSAEEKQPYVEKAERDVRRYREEMKDYTVPPEPDSPPKIKTRRFLLKKPSSDTEVEG